MLKRSSWKSSIKMWCWAALLRAGKWKKKEKDKYTSREMELNPQMGPGKRLKWMGCCGCHQPLGGEGVVERGRLEECISLRMGLNTQRDHERGWKNGVLWLCHQPLKSGRRESALHISLRVGLNPQTKPMNHQPLRMRSLSPKKGSGRSQDLQH